MMELRALRRPIPTLLAASLAMVAGCEAPAPPAPRVRVAAASDLQGAMPVLAAAFKQDRGIEVDATFGASGQLAEQIRQGAPFDLFLSANRGFVDRLVESKSIRADSVRPYARGHLVMVVHSSFGLSIKTMDDLKGDQVKAIAIANPETAPYGMAAKQALGRAGLWEALKPKIVPAESVGQALQFVRTGNAEVGFVGRALADGPGLEVVPIPLDACDPIIQAMGQVEGPDTRRDEARAFADFLLGETGQGILRSLGFAKVPPSSTAGAH